MKDTMDICPTCDAYIQDWKIFSCERCGEYACRECGHAGILCDNCFQKIEKETQDERERTRKRIEAE